MTGDMLAELIFGQKPIMLIEQSIVSWMALPWQDEISREYLRSEDIEVAKARLKNARLKNKKDFEFIR